MNACLATVVITACLSGSGVSVALGAPAVPPPGWTDQPSAWVGFTFSTLSPAPIGRTGNYEPITVTREGSFTDLIGAFDNWDQRDTNGDGVPDDTGWPAIWEAGGVRLERVDWCDAQSTQCQYTVAAGAGQPVNFFAGTVPTNPDGSPQFDPARFFQGSLSLPTPPELFVDYVRGVTGIPGTDGGPGYIRLDAGPSYDGTQGNIDGLTYAWNVTRLSDGATFGGSGRVADIQLDQDGFYCVVLTVTAADGYTRDSGACDIASTFQISGVARVVVPTPGPTPAPGGGPPAGGGAPAGGVPDVVFSNPAPRAPASLGGGGGAASAPTIVWLWRPEWFQPTVDAALPKTSGRPEVKGSAEIVVSTAGPDGASAGPWLVGLGAFGLLGGGYLFNRFRRVRLLEI